MNYKTKNLVNVVILILAILCLLQVFVVVIFYTIYDPQAPGSDNISYVEPAVVEQDLQRNQSIQHMLTVSSHLTEDSADRLYSKIEYWSTQFGIPVEYGLILVHTESDFIETAKVSKTSAYGLCQVTPVCLAEYNKVHKQAYKMSDMWDIDKNLQVGFWYYSRLLTLYGEPWGIYNYKDAYIAYNVGPSAFKRGQQSYKTGFYPNGKPYNPHKRYTKIEETILKSYEICNEVIVSQTSTVNDFRQTASYSVSYKGHLTVSSFR